MLHVEFFGVARLRAGVVGVELPLADEAVTLGAICAELARRFPELGRDCLDAEGPRAGFLVNLNGERFLTDLATPLRDGDCLLIMSADAGG